MEPKQPIEGMRNAAKDVAYDAQYLLDHGAKAQNIYVINLPNLGITPEATNNGKAINGFKSKLIGSLSKAFNKEIKNNILPPGVSIIDAEEFFNSIVKNKYIKVANKKYLFSNVSQSACPFNGPNALTCIPKNYKSGKYNKYLFAGNVHPTSYAQKLLALYIQNAIEQKEGKRYKL